jgi:hypothetical protein
LHLLQELFLERLRALLNEILNCSRLLGSRLGRGLGEETRVDVTLKERESVCVRMRIRSRKKETRVFPT